MAEVQAREQLTLKEALGGLGWLPLFLMGLGGLSLIDIVEKAILHNLSLITPFQIVLDGYHRITTLIGVFIEPLLRPSIDWINAQFGWRLQLQPFWRPLLALEMVIVLGWARALWRTGSLGYAILVLVVLGLGALAGSVIAGLLPLDGRWWVQGLLAGVPQMAVWLATALATAVHAMLGGDFSAARRDFAMWTLWALGIGVIAFAAATAVSFVPGIGGGSGVLVLGGVVAGLGIFYLEAGLREADRYKCHIGLAVLGGFVTAGLVLFANTMVTALSRLV